MIIRLSLRPSVRPSVSRAKCSLTDRYRLHLSAADLLFVLSLPFWAVDAALADWRLGAVACVAVHVIYTVNLYGSVLILAFISLDRYLAVVRPTDTNTGGLRQLLASRLVYAGKSRPPHPTTLQPPLLSSLVCGTFIIVIILPVYVFRNNYIYIFTIQYLIFC